MKSPRIAIFPVSEAEWPHAECDAFADHTGDGLAVAYREGAGLAEALALMLRELREGRPEVPEALVAMEPIRG